MSENAVRLILCVLTLVTTGEAFISAMPMQRGPPPDNYYTGESANVSRLLDSLLKGYDKRLRPNYKVVNNRTAVTGPPVEVGITMFVSSVSSISEVDMDFTLDFYFRQVWMDPRLAFPDSEEELCISNEMLAKIWWPDTFFANAKVAKFHEATTQNAFLRIKPNGQVLQSLRLTVTAMCRMDLIYFPMDSQTCSLEIESYGYSVKDITYNWKDGSDSVAIDKEVQLPQFKVRGYRAKEKLAATSTGNYSRLSCELYFVRSLGYYIIQIYVPSTLIVVMSWVSFWLPREAVPARVALGITTALTMTTLISSTNASLPKISYLKSIDVYLVTCFCMVFASILEYAAVSYLSNRSKRKNKRRTSDVSCTPAEREKLTANGSSFTCRKCETLPANDPIATEVRLTSLRKLHTECDLRSLSGGAGTTTNYFSLGSCRHPHCRASEECKCAPPPPPPPPESHHTTRTPERSAGCYVCSCLSRPTNIDQYSRVLFPLTFVCFNILYWIAYLNISHETELDTFTPFLPSA